MLFIIFFEFSLGPLLWIYMSEIMTDKGLSLGLGVNWITTCFIGFFTNSLITAFGGGDEGSGRLFVGCGVITALCGFFVIFIVKETKGLSNQEVEYLYSQDPDFKIERSSYLQLNDKN
jgi:hypothetical protein